jgi:hypothetical protein
MAARRALFLALGVLVAAASCSDPNRPSAGRSGPGPTATPTAAVEQEEQASGEAAVQQGGSAGARFTLGLALRSAAIERTELDDDEREFVRFCFGEDVHRLGAPAAFTHPGRARIHSGTNFRPHHDARISSGSRARASSGSTTRSATFGCARSSEKTSSPPAISMTSLTQRMPRSAGRTTPRRARVAGVADERPTLAPDRSRAASRPRAARRLPAAEHPADHPDRAQGLLDAALVEREDVQAGGDEVADDVALQVGEGEHEARLERQNAVDLRAGEGADVRLPPRLGRAYRITGHPHEAVAGAQGIGDLDVSIVRQTIRWG